MTLSFNLHNMNLVIPWKWSLQLIILWEQVSFIYKFREILGNVCIWRGKPCYQSGTRGDFPFCLSEGEKAKAFSRSLLQYQGLLASLLCMKVQKQCQKKIMRMLQNGISLNAHTYLPQLVLVLCVSRQQQPALELPQSFFKLLFLFFE